MATQIRLFVVSRFSLPAQRFFRREALVTATIQSRDKRCTNSYYTHTHTHTHTCTNCYYTHTHTKMHELLFHRHTHTQRYINCCSTDTHTHTQRCVNCYPYTHTHPHFRFPSPFTRQGQVGLHLMPWSHFSGGVNGDASTNRSEQLRKTVNPDCSLYF